MFLHSCSVGFAISSLGRASDCSSEGRRFEPGLVDIKTSLTQLVECQPHELKAVGSIPKRGTSCFNSICPLLYCIHTKKLSCLKNGVEFDMNDILYEFKNLHHF